MLKIYLQIKRKEKEFFRQLSEEERERNSFEKYQSSSESSPKDTRARRSSQSVKVVRRIRRASPPVPFNISPDVGKEPSIPGITIDAEILADRGSDEAGSFLLPVAKETVRYHSGILDEARWETKGDEERQEKVETKRRTRNEKKQERRRGGRVMLRNCR